MKYSFIFLLILMLACASESRQNKTDDSHSTASQKKSSVGVPPMSQLDWLVGTWQVEGKNVSPTFEEWTKLNGEKFMGRSYQTFEGDTIVKETRELVHQKDSIVYKATVAEQNGGQAIDFVLLGGKTDSLSFHNEMQEFPKRIVYRRANRSLMYVYLYGDKSGYQTKMKKIK